MGHLDLAKGRFSWVFWSIHDCDAIILPQWEKKINKKN